MQGEVEPHTSEEPRLVFQIPNFQILFVSTFAVTTTCLIWLEHGCPEPVSSRCESRREPCSLPQLQAPRARLLSPSLFSPMGLERVSA